MHLQQLHRIKHSKSLSRAAIVALCMLGGAGTLPQAADAETRVNSKVASNTTWTGSGSPYVLESQIEVTPGTTLTIEAGVTVEFNAPALYDKGVIKAIGTASNPVIFTSVQGAAGAGAPGQYEGIIVNSESAASQFTYTHFYFGGSGSGGYYGYGELWLNKGSASLEHDVFEQNAYSGVKESGSGALNIAYSTFSHNGDGVSVVASSPGSIVLTYNHVTNNLQDGVFFNIPERSTNGAAVMSNEITRNGRYGIGIQAYCSMSLSGFPHGNGNDIYDNGPNLQYPPNGSELHTLTVCEALPVDWSGNFWGNAYFVIEPEPLPGPFVCEDTIPEDWYQPAAVQSKGYLAYASGNEDPTLPPPGPISTARSLVVTPIECPDKNVESLKIYSLYNSFDIEPGQIATEYIPIPVG